MSRRIPCSVGQNILLKEWIIYENEKKQEFLPSTVSQSRGGVLLSIGVVASSLLPAGTAWAEDIIGNKELGDEAGATKYSNIQVTVKAHSNGYVVKKDSEEVVGTSYHKADDCFYAYNGSTPNAVTGNSVILTSDSNVQVVFGAQNNSGTVGGTGAGDGNKVTVNGGTIGNNGNGQIVGGFSYGATAINNSVTINSGEVSAVFVFGGYSQSVAATGNSVAVTGGNVTITASSSYGVIGGLSEPAAANSNEVTITGGTVEGKVYGGYSLNGAAESNKVTIGGSITQVNGNVYGGKSGGGEVNSNEVTITGGTVTIPKNSFDSGIYGGYNYYATNCTATGNKVYIKGGKVEGDSEIAGGYANDTASNNEVEISGGEIVSTGELRISGGYSSNVDVTGNSVTISNGTVGDGTNDVLISGGYTASDFDVTGNSVVITGGTVNCGADGTIYGGSGFNTVKNNSVTITGGEVTGTIYGAYGNENEAVVTENTVTIKGGTINGNVYGAYGDEAVTVVKDNTVEIAGGTINGDVYGATRKEEGVTLSNNKVIWSGGVVNGTVGADKVEIAGADGNPATTIEAPVVEVQTGSSWNFYSKDFTSDNPRMNVKGDVSGSGAYYFYLDENVQVNASDAAYLSIIGTADLTNATVGVAILKDKVKETTAKVAKGDKIYLVKATTLKTSAKSLTNDTTGMAVDTIAAKYKFDLGADDNYLYAIYAGKGISEQAKAIAEIQTTSSILVTDAMVYGAEEGMGAATLAATEAGGSDAYVGFGTIGFGNMRTNTGSHVDTKGYNLVAGAAKQNLNKNGSLTTGIFVEYGRSNSESVCDSGDYGEIVSKGNGHYIGGGLMAKQLNKTGTYYEGSLRVGKVNSEYESDNIGDIPKHDASATYYGIHLGYGKVFNMGKDVELDVYGKYFYSHVGGRDITIDGSDFSFDATNSHLLRVGTRWTMKSKGGFRNYVGLALQNEFAGSQDGRAEDMAIDAPSQKGFSGMLELGTKRAFDSRNKSFWEVGLKGYVGRRQGVLGQVKLEWQF